MKVKTYKYIIISQTGAMHYDRPIYSIQNKRSSVILATLEWYPRWNCYVFIPREATIFNAECMENIVEFLKTEVEV